MMAALERLFRPRTIATFGGKPAERMIEQCDRIGFTGEIWPVHPQKTSIGARSCFQSIDSLPDAPDVAFVGVNRELTIRIVKHLSDIGAGGAICYASGFREANDRLDDGCLLQDRLLDAAGDMPIVGPNCYGLINALDGVALWPDQHGLMRQQSGVAIIMQSSNIAINVTMQKRGLPIAMMLTGGNQAQLSLADLAIAALRDKRITAIGLHMEGLGPIHALEDLAILARDLRKPVTVLKVGRGESAQAAALSHTASLSGSDKAADAVFRRLGLGRVNSLSAFLETLKLLHVHGALPGKTICSMSCSGGEAALMADAAEEYGIALKPLSDERRAAVGKALSPRAVATNPLDYDTFDWTDHERLRAIFSAMMDSGFDLSLLVLDYPRTDRCDPADWLISERALRDAVAQTGERAALVATLPENLPEEFALDLCAAGIAPLIGVDDALQAVAASAAIGAAWSKNLPARMLADAMTSPDGPEVVLDEVAAKDLLAGYGIAIPAGRVAKSTEDAVRAASDIGFPVALKGLGITHKSEARAVVVGLDNETRLIAAAEAMNVPARGFLVERMVENGVAELIVGVRRDAAAGLVLTIGAGGLLVELLKDSATLTLPTDEVTVRETLNKLKIARLMEGFRGRPVADIDTVIAAVMAVASFAEAYSARLIELDVNPLIAGPAGEGAVAADALIRLKER